MANQKTSQYPLADLGILFTNGGLLDFSQAVSISISPPSITYDSRGLEILDFISLIENNIYHNDGVIPENRTVDADGNMLSFINGAEYSFTGDVFRYTSNLSAELRVDDTGALIGKNTSQYLSIDDTGARLVHNTNINLDCVDVIFDQLTAGTVPYLDSNIALKSSIVTLLELNNLSGSTSNIQAQINALASGVSSWKDPVIIAVDTNVTLSGEQTIQGETTSNSRVLLWQQTDPTENGIWVTDSGSWTRATDFDSNTDKIAGSVTVILAGDYAEHRFICSNNDPVVVGTDAISFIDLPGEYVGTTNRITISGNIIDISTSYAGQTSITTLGTISTGTWNGTVLSKPYQHASTVYNDQSNSYTAGMKQTFQADAINAGLRLSGVTTNPSSLVGGDMWYRSDDGFMRYYDGNASTVRTLVNLAGTQTLSNKLINRDNNTITNLLYTDFKTVVGNAGKVIGFDASGIPSLYEPDIIKSISVEHTTTLDTAVNLTGMDFSVVASGKYAVDGFFATGCTGTGGVKFTATLPSGTMKISPIGFAASATGFVGSNILTSGGLTSSGYNTVNSQAGYVYVKGVIEVGGTGGTVQFQFAAGTAGQTASIKTTSYVRLIRIV